MLFLVFSQSQLCISYAKENVFQVYPLSFRRRAIHAEAPEFVEMSTEQEILVTGIKVVDLLAPYAKGGKIGMLHSYLFFSKLGFCFS